MTSSVWSMFFSAFKEIQSGLVDTESNFSDGLIISFTVDNTIVTCNLHCLDHISSGNWGSGWDNTSISKNLSKVDLLVELKGGTKVNELFLLQVGGKVGAGSVLFPFVSPELVIGVEEGWPLILHIVEDWSNQILIELVWVAAFGMLGIQ